MYFRAWLKSHQQNHTVLNWRYLGLLETPDGSYLQLQSKSIIEMCLISGYLEWERSEIQHCQLSNCLCSGFGWDALNFLHSSLQGLCISSVVKTALVVHGFGYWWAVLVWCKGFLSNPPPTALKVCRLEMGKRLGEGITGTADPKNKRHIPCHMMSSLEIKAEGKENDGRIFVVMSSVFPS